MRNPRLEDGVIVAPVNELLGFVVICAKEVARPDWPLLKELLLNSNEWELADPLTEEQLTIVNRAKKVTVRKMREYREEPAKEKTERSRGIRQPPFLWIWMITLATLVWIAFTLAESVR